MSVVDASRTSASVSRAIAFSTAGPSASTSSRFVARTASGAREAVGDYLTTGRPELMGTRTRESALFLNARGGRLTRQGAWLIVRAAGYRTYNRQVIITSGETYSVRLNMQESDEGTGPCDQFGPAYNQDNICFDSRPVPLSPTLISVSQDAPIFPRQAILLIRVSRNGTTMEARVYAPSNVETFNNEALDMARNLRWNPAQKNGEPTEAWVQWPFQPVRQ